MLAEIQRLNKESVHGQLAVPDQELLMDVRKLTPAHLKGCDCVMHLAAISNDPMGELVQP